MDIFSPPYCKVTAYCSTLVISIWVNYRLLGNRTAIPSVWVREGTTGMQNNGEMPREKKKLSARHCSNLKRVGCCSWQGFRGSFSLTRLFTNWETEVQKGRPESLLEAETAMQACACSELLTKESQWAGSLTADVTALTLQLPPDHPIS